MAARWGGVTPFGVRREAFSPSGVLVAAPVRTARGDRGVDDAGDDDGALLHDQGLRGRRRVHVRQAAACRAAWAPRRPTSSATSRARRSTRPTRRKARPSLYGHGLLGDADEVDAGNVSDDGERAQLRVLRHRTGPASSTRTCRTSLASLSDFSHFHTVARPHAAGLPQLAVPGPADDPPERALRRTPAFQKNGQSVIDTRRLFYDGNSQGGIMGGGADRGGAGLQPRGARRAGDELLDPAAAQRRLRHLRRSSSTPTYPNELERPLLFA